MSTTAESPSHWADRTAAEVAASGRFPVISTGISPSGQIHIGNLREVLTADAVYRALRDQGSKAEFHFVADNFDPLRAVYDFLDGEVYAPRVGQPLSEIPCPCGDHPSYADHFLVPFLESLRKLRIDVEVVRADELYKSGRMTPCIVTALEKRDRIAAILHELTGKETDARWSPFNPLCPGCGRITRARVTGFSAEAETVSFECECGESGAVSMAGGGKLVWRIDWPARWKVLGVTVEPFGKDHATHGGSYDTGVRIAREIFGIEPPHPIPYEWIELKGMGDMSGSKGNVVSIARALEVVPPEALRYMVLRELPKKKITFDPGLPLLQLVDEIDDASSARRDDRSVKLSQAGGFRAVGVPFKHLVVVAQTVRFEPDQAVAVLERTGYVGVDRDAVRERMEYARRWLDAFAPKAMRFEVRDELPDEAKQLDELQRTFLGRLADELEEGMDGEAIHQCIHGLAVKLAEDVKPGVLFRAIYLSLLGKPQGPRAGWFLAFLGPRFTTERFREAASAPR